MKNLPLSLALAAFSGALTLKSPADFSPGMRRAYVLAPGAALGIIAATALRRGVKKGRKLAAAGKVDLVTPAVAGSNDDDAGSTAPVPSYVRADVGAARVPAWTLTSLAATVGVAVSGFLALSLVLDKRIETWLVRRGVARPRLVMAVVTAASSLVLDQVADSKDSGGARQ
ncbi:hypothetical protein [Arthrobacter sunyaminii]|uniref:Uncharacterized protein n=1 Tax=Arthrobacter sunyaminii TaxID=2816859 RepID=A0A975PE23_9MICC|nr:hypothetical protein [Arthrobacter sunyaminii]MBO0907470.1 hypothetical protein [Arthrobacter sunyaminii]QWQ35047.1 hypothetical protein KG104_10980 [Arthrobacter sunyaminii]